MCTTNKRRCRQLCLHYYNNNLPPLEIIIKSAIDRSVDAWRLVKESLIVASKQAIFLNLIRQLQRKRVHQLIHLNRWDSQKTTQLQSTADNQLATRATIIEKYIVSSILEENACVPFYLIYVIHSLYLETFYSRIWYLIWFIQKIISEIS